MATEGPSSTCRDQWIPEQQNCEMPRPTEQLAEQLSPWVTMDGSHGAEVSRDQVQVIPRNESHDLNLASLEESSPEAFAAGCKLLLAAANDNTELCKSVIRNGTPIDFRDYDHRSAIHVASSEGHLGIVKFLADSGARINRLDRWGGTPLDDACRQHHLAVAAYLRSIGGKRGVTDRVGALIEAASKGDVDAIKLLMEDGAAIVDGHDYDKR